MPRTAKLSKIDDEILITNKIGRKYYCPDHTFYKDQLANSGPYQVTNMRYLRSLRPNARTILDVGMNIGMNTIEYATWGKWVMGFEPASRIHKMAVKNVMMAEKQTIDDLKPWYKDEIPVISGKIQVCQLAVGSAIGMAKMCIYKDAGHNNIAESDATIRETILEFEEVPMVTVDSLNIDDLDIMKVDTEGFEYNVLLGAVETIKRCKPIIQVETIEEHAQYGSSVHDIQKILVDLGYKVTLNNGKELPDSPWIRVNKKIDRFFIPRNEVLDKYFQEE